MPLIGNVHSKLASLMQSSNSSVSFSLKDMLLHVLGTRSLYLSLLNSVMYLGIISIEVSDECFQSSVSTVTLPNRMKQSNFNSLVGRKLQALEIDANFFNSITEYHLFFAVTSHRKT